MTIELNRIDKGTAQTRKELTGFDDTIYTYIYILC